GRFDLVVFAEPYAQYAGLLKSAHRAEGGTGPTPVLVAGTLESGDPPKILVREGYELERAEEMLAGELMVRIRTDEATGGRLTAMRTRLAKSPGDCAVRVYLVIPDQSETVLAISSLRGVRPDAALKRDLDELFGRAVTEVRV